MVRKKLTLDIRLGDRGALAGDEFVVAGEELLFYSMFANLVKNAVEASPEGGAIAVSLACVDFPTIAIHNMGAVPMEIRGRVFDKYTTSGKKGGSGLGVYSAALIAKTLGGRIDLETSEELGTTVTVGFPPKSGE
jgi:signal transduction histidine kinase